MELEEFRVQRKLTYRALADLIGLSVNMTFRIAKGKANCISLQAAQKIVKATGGYVSIENLLSSIGDC